MSLVIDSSVTLSWCFADERTELTSRLLYQVAEHGAVAPALWRLEVANGLQSKGETLTNHTGRWAD